MPVGDPLDPATFVGPVVTEAAMERILGVIDRARADGATLLVGGCRLGGDLADGWFVAPTVFGDVDHDSDLARNEVFGPVQAVLRFTSEDEVLAKANDSPFGLGAYLHTRDNRRIQRFVRELESGTVVVNGMGGHLAGHPVRRLQAERVRPRGRAGRDRGDGPPQDGLRLVLARRSDLPEHRSVLPGPPVGPSRASVRTS